MGPFQAAIRFLRSGGSAGKTAFSVLYNSSGERSGAGGGSDLCCFSPPVFGRVEPSPGLTRPSLCAPACSEQLLPLGGFRFFRGCFALILFGLLYSCRTAVFAYFSLCVSQVHVLGSQECQHLPGSTTHAFAGLSCVLSVASVKFSPDCCHPHPTPPPTRTAKLIFPNYGMVH